MFHPLSLSLSLSPLASSSSSLFVCFCKGLSSAERFMSGRYSAMRCHMRTSTEEEKRPYRSLSSKRVRHVLHWFDPIAHQKKKTKNFSGHSSFHTSFLPSSTDVNSTLLCLYVTGTSPGTNTSWRLRFLAPRGQRTRISKWGRVS